MTSNIWNQTHVERSLNYKRPWYRAALSLLCTLEIVRPTIVEVGCGCGEFATLVQKTNVQSRYIGLDGHYSSASTAHELGHRTIIADFERELPLPSVWADIVVSLEVVEHIAAAEQFLVELNRILKPGGYLILSTPNVGWLPFRLRYLIRAEIAGEGIHLRFFNKSGLSHQLAKAGFRFICQGSYTPIVGYNRLRRVLFSRRPKYVSVPDKLEGLAALDFVWLLRKEHRVNYH